MAQLKCSVPAISGLLLLMILLGCGSSTNPPSAVSTPRSAPSTRLFDVSVGGKRGFIDSTGKLAINPQFDDISTDWRGTDPFSEGLVAVCIGPCTNGKDVPNGKWGYIDRKGTVVINLQFDVARPFSEGLAAVCLGDCRTNGDSKWGFIDKTGKYAVNPQFGEAWAFHEGLASVCVGSYLNWACQGKEGFIDKTGKFVINPEFDNVGEFQDGLASIFVGGSSEQKRGYIDKTGKVIWEPSK